MLAKRKLTDIKEKKQIRSNSIETLISQSLIDLGISHEEFKTIVNEKETYKRMKENIRIIKSSGEVGENKSIRENKRNAQN